ncbi:hypothetical protein [Sporolactobacillus terrae]|uniref:hypothetical protein n=1 Tax=Sporolactobacillus terrae TaxID=269673 RepID=UPI0011183F13|nr:hypothetical protein [Sporolactobacillus terrae]
MSANTVAIKPSNKTQSFQLFSELHIPFFTNLKTSNKFEAMSQLENDFYDAEITLKNGNGGNDLHIVPADFDIKVQSVMDAETSEELISMDDNGNFIDHEFEEDVKQGHLVAIEDKTKQSEPFKANLPESTLNALKAEQDKLFHAAENSNAYFNQSALNGFEKALRLIGVSIPYPTKEGEDE